MSRNGNGLPANWESAVLGEIAEVRLGRQRSPKRAAGDHMRPYVRAANVTWDGISLHDVKEMDFTPEEFKVYALKHGDILLAEASGSASEVGKPAVWKGEVPNCCFQNTLIRVRACEHLVPFLHLHFTKDAVTGAFAAASRGVGIHHLGAQAMQEWVVTLPPLPEQNRIVEAIESYFTRLDDIVATLERVQRNLKRYRTSVLKAAVEGRLVPTEAALAHAEGREYEPAEVLLERILKERRRRWEEAGGRGKYKEPVAPATGGLPELPDGWCWTSVDAVGDVLLGRRRAPEYRGDLYPYLRVANVRDDRLDLSSVLTMPFDERDLERYRLGPGDILASEGQSPELVGQSAIYRGGVQNLCFQATLHRFRPLRHGPSSEFAQLVFRAHVRTGVFTRLASITTNIAHLTLEKFKIAPFPLPPAEEQIRIVAEAARLLSIADGIERVVRSRVRRCTHLRQSILKWAFEGKVANQNPNDEPADVLLERIKAERESNRTNRASQPGRRKRVATAVAE